MTEDPTPVNSNLESQRDFFTMAPMSLPEAGLPDPTMEQQTITRPIIINPPLISEFCLQYTPLVLCIMVSSLAMLALSAYVTSSEQKELETPTTFGGLFISLACGASISFAYLPIRLRAHRKNIDITGTKRVFYGALGLFYSSVFFLEVAVCCLLGGEKGMRSLEGVGTGLVGLVAAIIVWLLERLRQEVLADLKESPTRGVHGQYNDAAAPEYTSKKQPRSLQFSNRW